MELKSSASSGVTTGTSLLIVPYGIEIMKTLYAERTAKLLIVPYGIEIMSEHVWIEINGLLLIVPYGIEIV